MSGSKAEQLFRGKTFGDFLISPFLGLGDHRADVPLETNFSRNIKLNLPIVSANMDTVTGPEMCIAIAQEGGIGILPRSDAISIDTQVRWIKKVKRAENFIIEEPYKIGKYDNAGDARAKMAQHGVSTLLVVEDDHRLVGILSNRYIFRFCNNDDDPVYKWMVSIEKYGFTEREEIDSIQIAEEELMKHPNIDKLPWVDSDMGIRGLLTIKDISNLLKHTWANKDAKGRLRVGAAIGVNGDYIERAAELMKANVDVIVIDVAHGHHVKVGSAIENFRKNFPDFELVVGNIVTAEAARYLITRGIDGLKVGIGAGYGCRTRLETGIGVPQLHAVRNIWQELSSSVPIPFISDGGVRDNAHIAMAIAAGASSVMLGSHLAGTDEAPGELLRNPKTGARYKLYRGMTSPTAKLDSVGSADRISNVEGQTREIDYKGSARDILRTIRENLQSFVSYVGKTDLRSVRLAVGYDPERYFIELSQAAREESYIR